MLIVRALFTRWPRPSRRRATTAAIATRSAPVSVTATTSRTSEIHTLCGGGAPRCSAARAAAHCGSVRPMKHAIAGASSFGEWKWVVYEGFTKQDFD